MFDATHFDGRRFGWRVDDVYRVTSIDPSDIDDSPARDESIRGVVNREDGFVIWASPKRALG